MNQNNSDKIYATARDKIEKFRFDENVAAVFPDMLKRSIPGYPLIQEMIGVLSHRYAQDNTHIYDLGCSLAASSISMLKNIQKENCTVIAIDNSEAMIKGAQENLSSYSQQQAHKTNWQVICDDIQNIDFKNASIINLNFTLQFIDPSLRLKLIKKIYQGLNPNGILILSEKVAFPEMEDELLSELHHGFKKANGYSDLEISQKRSALEKVLIRDSEAQHIERLQSAGFNQVVTWFQCFNFISLLALKTS